MSIPAPILPRTPLPRLRWALADSWTITRRDLTHWQRQPAAVITSTLVFPVMIVLMFGYLLGGAITVPGGSGYREFLLPGMFAMTMVFGIGVTLVAVSSDAARGVTDRFRSMPATSSAVVIGRATADMLNSAVALAVLVGCGLLTGWAPHSSIPAAAGALGLLLLLRFAFVWIGSTSGWSSTPTPKP
jgi:ABC-2 type transport system permease protein